MVVKVERIETKQIEDTKARFQELVEEAFEKNYKAALIRIVDTPCACGMPECDGTALRAEFYETNFDYVDMRLAIKCLAGAYSDLSPVDTSKLN